MRITFFGSSHGVPEPNRKCSCAMVEAGGRKYLIDAGTDPVDELVKRGIGISEIRAVFITHLHGDHTDGLVHFLDLLSWYYKEASPAFYVPKTELKDVLRRVAKALRPEGVLYASFKYGTFEGIRDGRYFTCFTEESLKDFWQEAAPLKIFDLWITEDVRPEKDEQWINLLARKT